MTIIGLERELNTLAASATATGIWLSLEAFRQLPLDAQSRCQLLQLCPRQLQHVHQLVPVLWWWLLHLPCLHVGGLEQVRLALVEEADGKH